MNETPDNIWLKQAYYAGELYDVTEEKWEEVPILEQTPTGQEGEYNVKVHTIRVLPDNVELELADLEQELEEKTAKDTDPEEVEVKEGKEAQKHVPKHADHWSEMPDLSGDFDFQEELEK